MLAPLDKSDHAVILLDLQIQLLENRQLPSFSWFYQKTRKSELVAAATMVNWQHISSLESVTDMWLTLRDWILDLRNRFVPYSPKKTGKDVPWIRSRHRRVRHAKQVAFFLFKAIPSHATLSVYKAESRRLSKLLRISRRQYESKLAVEVKFNPWRFFAHVRRNRRLKQRIMALRAVDVISMNDAFIASIIEFAFFVAFAHWR